MMNGFILQENTSILISRNGKTLYSILHRSLDLTECCGDCFHFSTLHWLSLCSHLSNEIKGNILYWFLLSFCGIFLISFAGNLSFHPFGDFLAIAAALMWMVYSLLVKKIASWGHSVIDTTKMIFLYGILFIMPLFF